MVKSNPLPASKRRAKDSAAEDGFENEKPPDPVEMLMQKARGHHRQNRYGQAIRYYEEVLKIKPMHFEATFNLAAAHIAARQYAEAHPLLEEAKHLQPDNAEVLLNLAIVAIGTGRPAEAFALLQEVERRKPEARFEVCMHRGVAYHVQQEYEQALYWYNQALALNPHHLRLLFDMAVVYDTAQQFQEAIRFYGLYLQKADAVDPAGDPVEKKQIEKRIRYLLAFAATRR